MEQTLKPCLACNKPLRGRIDKKFCDDYCRNNYNNTLKSKTSNYVRNVNNALLKNRRILETLMAKNDTVKIRHTNLLQQGFLFTYYTHQFTNAKNNVYNFCYEFGYLSLDKDWFLIVKREEKL
jgi:hypothetical protein